MEPIKLIKSDYEVLMDMADEYSISSNKLACIRNEKSSAIMVLMSDSKSVKEAEMKWNATESGKEETTLVYFLKGLEKRMSALRAKINGDRAY